MILAASTEIRSVPGITSHRLSALCVWISIVCVFSSSINSVRSGLGTEILGTLWLPGVRGKVPAITFTHFLFKLIASKHISNVW